MKIDYDFFAIEETQSRLVRGTFVEEDLKLLARIKYLGLEEEVTALLDGNEKRWNELMEKGRIWDWLLMNPVKINSFTINDIKI